MLQLKEMMVEKKWISLVEKLSSLINGHCVFVVCCVTCVVEIVTFVL